MRLSSGCDALEQARAAGERKPHEWGRPWALRNSKRQRGCDPNTRAVEAVHELSDHSVADAPAQPHHHVAGSILRRKQMRDAPAGE